MKSKKKVPRKVPDHAKSSNYVKSRDARSRLTSISTTSLSILVAGIIAFIFAIASSGYYGSSFETSIDAGTTSIPIVVDQHSSMDDDADTVVQRIITTRSPYVVLGVSRRGATLHEVESQYKKLSKIVHPDKNHSPHATKAMRVLINARTFLKKKLKPKDEPVVAETAKGNEEKKKTKQTSMDSFLGIVAVGGGGGGGDGGGGVNNGGDEEDGNGMDGSGGGNEDGDDRRRITPAPTPLPTQTPSTVCFMLFVIEDQSSPLY